MFMTYRGWMSMFFTGSFATELQDYCKPIINNLLFQRTYMKNVIAKNKAITTKKLWSRYDIFDHQKRITCDI